MTFLDKKFGRVLAMTAVFFLAVLAAPAQAEILTVFSDQGVPGMPPGYNPIIAFSGGPAIFLGTSTVVAPPEGYTSFQTIDQTGLWAGWGVVYPTAQNLSRFNSGEYRFWVYSSTGNVEVQFKDGTQALVMDTTLSILGWDYPTMHDRWVLMRIPLAPYNLTSVQYPGLFTANQGPATFYIDDVRFVTSEVSPNYFHVALNNRADNSAALAITWTNATAASTWGLADQYIQLTVDPNVTGWGVQIYTDNTNSTPRYSGAVSSTTPGGGLVDTSTTTFVLPMAWETVAVTSPTLAAQEPNSCPANGFGCLWFYMQDRAVFSHGNPFVFDGAAFVTTKTNSGIHYAQGTTFNNPAEFGAADPPNIIYLEANFGLAPGGRTYTTTALVVEFYTP